MKPIQNHFNLGYIKNDNTKFKSAHNNAANNRQFYVSRERQINPCPTSGRLCNIFLKEVLSAADLRDHKVLRTAGAAHYRRPGSHFSADSYS